MNRLANLGLFQLGWFACILGAAKGVPWLGVLFVAAGFIVHLRLSGAWAAEARIGAAACTMGLAADSAAMSAGAFEFPPHSRLGWPIPLWMPALWLNFATTLDSSLGWLRGRYALAAAVGSIGGALSYFAGERLGAIVLSDAGLAIVLLEWFAATPALVRLSEKLKREEHG